MMDYVSNSKKEIAYYGVGNNLPKWKIPNKEILMAYINNYRLP